MTLADWTPERMARLEADLAAVGEHNGIAHMYAGFIAQHSDDMEAKRQQVEEMYSALRHGRVTQEWNGQEVPANAGVRHFMRDWYEAEGMYW